MITNLLDLTGKTVLITGGAGAIGRVIVKVLVEHGATVAVNDIVPEPDAAEAPAEAKAISLNIHYFQADATQPETVEALFQRVETELGLPQVVCCHAGMVDAYPVEHYPLDRFDALMQVNLRSAFIVAQVAVRRWQEQGVKGQLIFTTSWVQDVPWPEITPYNTSKAGMKAMMRGFARELAPQPCGAGCTRGWPTCWSARPTPTGN